MRAVIDTNVVVSGMISRKSYPAKVLDSWALGQFTPVVSPELVREYAAVLTREKFAILGTTQRRMELLEKMLSLPWVVMVYPEIKVTLVQADPWDNKIIECAIEGNTEWIVTGDKHLLELRSVESVTIGTPEEFWQVLQPKSK